MSTFEDVAKLLWPHERWIENEVPGSRAEAGERSGFRYAVDIYRFPRVEILASYLQT